MKCCRFASWILALSAAAAVLVFLAAPPRPGSGHEEDEKETEPGPAIELPERPIELIIELGRKDEEQVFWEGELKLSEGKILNVELMQAAANSTLDGAKFKVRAARRPGAKPAQPGRQNRGAQRRARQQNRAARQQARQAKPPAETPAKGDQPKQTAAKPAAQFHLVPVRMRVTLDAPLSARLEMATDRGSFDFSLEEATSGEEQEYLDGQASVSGELAAIRLTGAKTEDDFPVMAKAPDGTVWLAYVEYTPGPPVVFERVAAGNFDLLEPHGHGDHIRLMQYDGRSWHAPLDVTEGQLDVWRPSIAIDKQGMVRLAWAQPVDGDWEIFSRRFTPPRPGMPRGRWSAIERVTKVAGTDYSVQLVCDAGGQVWAAWQAWRDGNYDILLAKAGAEGGWSKPKTISDSKADDWSPAAAADSQGRVYVAWDTYDRDNYDVKLYVEGDKPRTMTVADSARFEARPALVCDAADRLWVAYEEGDEQWGKDYASADGFRKVGFERNPGFALYVNRTLRVKCVSDGQWKQPSASLEEAFGDVLTRGKSVPRLATDAAGGLWLALRHHPLNDGAGEVWHSYALRYDGKEWSEPVHLNNSSNLMDNRPALVPLEQGLLAVYSSDRRYNTQNRGEDDLYLTLLDVDGPAGEPQLVDAEESPKAEVEPVHPHENEDVARLREFRLTVGDKKLRPLRGEFHRHTEFTAHRDQDGLLEDAWRYALDAGRLDWMGDGDHDNGNGHEYMWWLIQKTTDVHTHPPHFVAAMTYERSVVYPNGHRNVMMPRRGIRPLPRGKLPGTAEEGTPDTKMLYAYLKHFGAICSSHTSGTSMGTDWRDNDPEVEPVVEIYQGHRHNYEHFGAPRSATAQTQIGGYEPAGFIWNALERGYRLGFQSSSDHVSTHMSYGVVLAEEASRQGIIDAFKKRHSYAATDNIILIVRSGDQLMGDEFETSERPTLAIEAHGTAPIARLHIIRDNKYLDTLEPGQRDVERTFTDMDAQPGKTSYYYVRVEQDDGNLAWASPMWITYKP
ncbi:MAG TPA: hypothetical protein VNH11_35080 [Pirellulales bacterium]|nr:hypothetical protein [Pirellulales bacterium]